MKYVETESEINIIICNKKRTDAFLLSNQPNNDKRIILFKILLAYISTISN